MPPVATGSLGAGAGGTASPASPCRDGRRRAGTGLWRDLAGARWAQGTSPWGAAGAAAHGGRAVAVAPRSEAPCVAGFPPPSRSVKHAPLQRPRTPSPPGREERTTRLSVRDRLVTRREAGGAPAVPGPSPRALLGAALASGGSAARGAGGGGSAATGPRRGEGVAGGTDSDKA